MMQRLLGLLKRNAQIIGNHLKTNQMLIYPPVLSDPVGLAQAIHEHLLLNQMC
jgi:hypothetical protein